MSNIQKQHKISPAIAWLTIQKFIIFYCPLDGEHTTLLRASFFLSTWTCYFFSPTGIIAYADQEINMQVILKHSETNKKSKLFPWFMPYFSLIFTNVEQLVKGYLQIRKHNQM